MRRQSLTRTDFVRPTNKTALANPWDESPRPYVDDIICYDNTLVLFILTKLYSHYIIV